MAGSKQARARSRKCTHSWAWLDYPGLIFFIPWALLWSQIFGQMQPLPAGSGQVGGRGLGWPGLITTPTLPRWGDEDRRSGGQRGRRDEETVKMASMSRELV